MNILSELNTVISALNIPVETGIFSGVPPDEYAVLTPLADSFVLFGDNKPQAEICDVRVSLFTKGNYLKTARLITSSLLSTGFVITDRRYIGHESDTGYNNYAIDCSQFYGVKQEYGLEEM